MPQPGISAIGGEIEAFQAAAANPANYVYNGTISSSPAPAYAGMDPYTACDPAALEAQWGSDPDASRNCQWADHPAVPTGLCRRSAKLCCRRGRALCWQHNRCIGLPSAPQPLTPARLQLMVWT
jgi:hypothetical protein